MYNLFKSAIKARNYNLPDMLNKIESKWVEGALTDEQRQELIEQARINADFTHSVDLLKKIADLEMRISALERTISEPTEPDADVPTEDSGQITAPQFETGKWYYNGDLITYNDIVYVCTAPDGVVCVWNPDDYPSYWAIYTG